mgnify:FL=1
MNIFKAIIEKLISGAMPENFEDYAERPLNEILESLAELEKIAVNPCFASPVEYARIRSNGSILAEVFRGLSARYRARCYRLRFSPCQHRAGGVMIRKKGRLVRRKR